MSTVVSLLVVFALSLTMTWLWRFVSQRFAIVDVPNPRSSHVTPTPRGAGVAIVMSFLPLASWLFFSGQLNSDLMAALSAGLLIAAIGFADDFHSVSVRWRLVTHFAVAVIAVLVIGLPAEWLDHSSHPAWHWGIAAFTVCAVVWHLNLFNFMDGIDGIAGAQAAFVAGGGAVLSLYAGEPGFSILLAGLAAACLGFLFWNWPPAKVFMGDSGSGFLGYTLPVLALYSATSSVLSVWTWMILMSTFIVDASVTLLVRLLGNQDIFKAHRTHAYQSCARRFGSHALVTGAFLFVNLFWVLPLAYLSVRHRVYAPLAALIAILPLIGLALRYGAGTPEPAVQPRRTR